MTSKKDLILGIWLNLTPLAFLPGEGLVRLLGFILPSLVDNMKEVRIVASKDFNKPLLDFLSSLGLAHNKKVSIVLSGLNWNDPAERKRRIAVAKEQNVDVWFTLRPDHVDATSIPGAWTTLFADFLLFDYPFQVHAALYAELAETTRVGALSADSIISFSEYVAKNHVEEEFNVPRSNISVVPHGTIDYFNTVRGELESHFKQKFSSPEQFERHHAAEFLRAWLRRAAKVPMHKREELGLLRMDTLGEEQLSSYVTTFPYEDVDFVFCSTQNRPNKNLITAAAAVADLIRQEHAGVKMIMTGNLLYQNPSDPVGAYVAQNKLHNDILSLKQLPSAVHASLYRLAAVTVHPSPFEGSLPFTFSESLSLLTPVIMARGPAVDEFLTSSELDQFCFEPSSKMDLRRRIAHVLENRDAYLTKQLETLDRQKKRSWADVGREYSAAIRAAHVRRFQNPYLFHQPGVMREGGSVSGGKFTGEENDTASLTDPRNITRRIVPEGYTGNIELTFLCRSDIMTDYRSKFSASLLRWEEQSIAHYPPTHAVIEQTDGDNGFSEVKLTFPLPPEHKRSPKELRIKWLGGATAELHKVSWQLSASALANHNNKHGQKSTLARDSLISSLRNIGK